MGTDDKVKNAAERAKGHGKEAVGAATGNENLRAEGRGDKTKADIKDVGEQVKDAGRKVGKAAKR